MEAYSGDQTKRWADRQIERQTGGLSGLLGASGGGGGDLGGGGFDGGGGGATGPACSTGAVS
jgi:hypothetical protein